MAVVVVAGSSVPVSGLLSGNNASGVPWGSAAGKGGSRIEVRRLGSRVGARLSVERSGFLGDFLSNGEDSPLRELGWDNSYADGEKRSSRAQCVAGLQGRVGGRVFFMPFGPSRRGGGGGRSHARSEWERRQRAQEEKFREMLERELKARVDAASNKTRSHSYEFALLRELEKRLRFEEANRKEGGDGANDQQESAKPDSEGVSAGFGGSTYELMKELEKRLKTEREGQRGSRESPRERRAERGGRDFRTGEYTSLYDYMMEWGREMREERVKLEELWKSRDGSRFNDKFEAEERFRGQRRRRGEPDQSSATAAPAEKKEEEVEVEDEQSKATTPSLAPDSAQSNGTVVYLKNEANGAEIYLLGTSHVSQRSVDEVREVIERVKPDFVMVELCRKRYEVMESRAGQKDSPAAFVEQVARMLTSRTVGVVGKLVGIGLSSFYRLLSFRGLHPGKEFEVAIEEAKKVGAKVVLGDQDIDTTLNQLGQFNLNISVQDAFQFFGQRMPDDIAETIGGKAVSDEDMYERMRDRKVVRRFNEEMQKGAPTIYKALVSERNEVMFKALRNLTGKVVAVVGLAHVDGIEELWQQANEKYLSGQAEQITE